MDIKFNSLFDNTLSPDDLNHYSIDRLDTTLLLNRMVFQTDPEKEKGIQTLENRNFGNHYNYLLSGRPCASSLCTSKKFCDSAGWPETSGNVRKNICEMPLAPNASKIDPMIMIDNIDMEAKLRKIDIIDNKCHLKTHKEDPCSHDPDRCILKCHKDSIAGDYMLAGIKSLDTVDGSTPNTISAAIERAKQAQKDFCRVIPNKLNEVSSWNSNQPTRRRNIVNW